MGLESIDYVPISVVPNFLTPGGPGRRSSSITILEGKGDSEKGLIGVVRLKKENEIQGRKCLAAQLMGRLRHGLPTNSPDDYL